MNSKKIILMVRNCNTKCKCGGLRNKKSTSISKEVDSVNNLHCLYISYKYSIAYFSCSVNKKEDRTKGHRYYE